MGTLTSFEFLQNTIYKAVRSNLLFVALTILGVVGGLAYLLAGNLANASKKASNPLGGDRISQESTLTDPRIQRLGDTPDVEKRAGRSGRIQFINDDIGWLYDGGKLFRTEDGGGRWSLLCDVSPKQISQVDFLSPHSGWMIASKNLYKSDDGGWTWSLMPQLLPDAADADLCTVHFLKDGRRGWVAGAIYVKLPRVKPGQEYTPTSRYLSSDLKRELHGAVFWSEDGGNHWYRQLLTRDLGMFTTFEALDDKHAWAAGTAGAFYLHNGLWYAMSDGGTNQEELVSVNALSIEIGFPTFQPINIFFLDSRIGWLSNSNGYLATSRDGGRQWHDVFSLGDAKKGLPDFFTRLFFTDESHGWACTFDGDLYTTIDGGTAWQKHEAGEHIDDIFFLGSGDGRGLSRKSLFHLR